MPKIKYHLTLDNLRPREKASRKIAPSVGYYQYDELVLPVIEELKKLNCPITWECIEDKHYDEIGIQQWKEAVKNGEEAIGATTNEFPKLDHERIRGILLYYFSPLERGAILQLDTWTRSLRKGLQTELNLRRSLLNIIQTINAPAIQPKLKREIERDCHGAVKLLARNLEYVKKADSHIRHAKSSLLHKRSSVPREGKKKIMLYLQQQGLTKNKASIVGLRLIKAWSPLLAPESAASLRVAY